MKLTVTITEHESGASIFSLSGNLHGSPEVSDVARIDSRGIGILAAVAMSAQNAAGGLVLASLPERIEQILGVTNFLEFIESAESIPTALAKLDQMNLPTASD